MAQQQHGFFQYLRLKLIAVLLRFWISLNTAAKKQRDIDRIPPEVPRQRLRIPSRDPGRHILADLYLPPSTSSDSPLSILVNWHGSGFIIPLFGLDALFCARTARDAGIAVLDADYRKAPEHPFPCALQDAEDVLAWVASATQDHHHYSFDRERVGVCGFSAGGTIAAAMATTAHLIDNIRILVAVYPLVDMAKPPEEKNVPRPIHGRRHPAWALALFNDCYAPDVGSRTDPKVSPGWADVEDFPPTVALFTAEGDALRPEVEVLAGRLKEEGKGKKKVVCEMMEGVAHGFDHGCEEGSLTATRRDEMYAMIVKLLKESFGI